MTDLIEPHHRTYSIKKRYSVVVHDVNRVEFRQGVWNPTSTTVVDEEGTGRLAATIDLLDGSHAVDEIAKLTKQEPEDVEAVINHLAQKESPPSIPTTI